MDASARGLRDVVFARVEKNVDGPKRAMVAVIRGPRGGVSLTFGVGYRSLEHVSK